MVHHPNTIKGLHAKRDSQSAATADLGGKHSGSQPMQDTYAQQERNFMAGFRAIQQKVHGTAVDKGWWDDRRKLLDAAKEFGGDDLAKFADKAITGMVIALEHSELSEGLEGERKDLASDHIDGFSMLEEEYADVIIRIMDHAEDKKLNVAGAILSKLAFNDTREHKHGGKAF